MRGGDEETFNRSTEMNRRDLLKASASFWCEDGNSERADPAQNAGLAYSALERCFEI
jgi:hypothetical protein